MNLNNHFQHYFQLWLRIISQLANISELPKHVKKNGSWKETSKVAIRLNIPTNLVSQEL